MARGGKRPGAGRKKGYAAKSAEEARKIFAEIAEKEIVPIAKALVKKAKLGDVRAAKELFDRAYGRPISDEPPNSLPFVYNMAEVRERYRPD